MKVVWKMINGYGPYAYLQESVRAGDTVTSRHVRYLGKAGGSLQPGGSITHEGKQVSVPSLPASVAPNTTAPQALPLKSADAIIERVTQGRHAPQSRGYDEWLTRFALEQWGPQRARVVSGREFDATPGQTLHRSVRKAAHIESNIEGTRAGEGRYGSGYYYATEGPLKGISGGPQSVTWAAKLAPWARVLSMRDMATERRREWERIHGKPFELEEFVQRTDMDAFREDNGRLAAALGYDALTVNNDRYVVVLNNSALIVDERTIPTENRSSA